MQSRANVLMTSLREFIAQPDYPTLVLNARDADLVYPNRVLASFDREDEQAYYVLFPQAFTDAQSYMNDIAASASDQLEVLATERAGRGEPPLPALNIDITQTSISGISSGGFMTVQFQLAHSSIIKGAGVVAGGPFNCSKADVFRAVASCSCTGEPAVPCAVTESSADVPSLVAGAEDNRTQFEDVFDFQEAFDRAFLSDLERDPPRVSAPK